MKNKLFTKVLREVCDCEKEPVTLNEEGTEKMYTVLFWVRQNDDKVDYRWDVKATSPEDAIERLQSGKATGPYGQTLPRLARHFSAELSS